MGERGDVVADERDTSFAQVIAFNSALLAGGITGIVTPQASSLLHNASTVALSLKSSTPYRISNEDSR